MLTLIDEFTREYLAVEVGLSIKSERVRQILEKVCFEKGKPELIRSDNNSKFIGKAVGFKKTGLNLYSLSRESRGRMAKAKVLTGNSETNV